MKLDTKVSTLLACSSLLLCLSTSGTVAQQTAPAARPAAAPSGSLMIVTEGVFDLALGKSIDVTDKKLLLTFPRHPSNLHPENLQNGYVYLTINGTAVGVGGNNVPTGHRADLKKFSKQLGDRGDCFLDVVEVSTPKGGLATATLRLSCD